MFKFITHRSFWVNLLAAGLLALLLVFAFLQLLSKITRHGEHLTVPYVKGTKTEDAIKLLEDQGFDVTIQDSVYTDTLPPGVVIKQLPDSGATVKVNRTVFITVNCLIPPMITMPDLKAKSLDFAIEILKKNHLELGDTIYKPDFMRGSVLEQLYMGRRILPGASVQWGSDITLIIGAGVKDSSFAVPDLIGMTYNEAKYVLDSLGVIAVTVPDPDVQDTLNAFIYKQDPQHLNAQNQSSFIKPGMFMDVWLSTTKRAIDSIR